MRKAGEPGQLVAVEDRRVLDRGERRLLADLRQAVQRVAGAERERQNRDRRSLGQTGLGQTRLDQAGPAGRRAHRPGRKSCVELVHLCHS